MFENLFSNLEDVAGKLGLPADQVKAMAETLQGKLGQGGDPMSALLEVAKENGLSADKLQDMLGGLGGAEGLLGKVAGGIDAKGDGIGLDDLTGFAKGLFSK